MALVDPTTGEVVQLLNKTGARDLTDRIKATVESLWFLLLESYERRAWAALDYSSWREYATAEFELSESRAYQYLDSARVVKAIEAASVSTIVETPGRAAIVRINEHQARKLKPHLADVTNKVRERVTHATEVETAVPPERVQEIVGEVVADALDELKKAQEDAAAIRALNEEFQPPGFDPEADRRHSILCQSFLRLLTGLTELPPADELVRQLEAIDRPVVDAHLDPALLWLTEFAESWRTT